jgi:thiamine pyrophosphate-dependent acetolactate synthase large subunit-like protein
MGFDVNFDVALQEEPIAAIPPLPDPARFAPPKSPDPSGPLLAEAARLLARAERPVILMGRTSRDLEA